MKMKENGDVNSPVESSTTLDYQSKPISVKLTSKLEGQLDYIANETQMSRSNIIRYSITELYKKIRQQTGEE